MKFKTQLTVILSVVITLSVLGGLTALFMFYPTVGKIAVISAIPITLIFSLIGYIKNKKQVKRFDEFDEKYGEAARLILESIPVAFYAGDYEYAKKNVKILSRGTIEIPEELIEKERNEVKNLYGDALDHYRGYINDYVTDRLIDKGYCAYVRYGSPVEAVVNSVNSIIRAKELPVKTLTAEEITVRDDEFLKNRRKDNESTDNNDMNIAHDILSRQGFELVELFTVESYLTIVSNEEFKKLHCFKFSDLR